MLSTIMPEILTSNPGSLKSDSVPSLSTVIMMSESHFSGTFSFGDILKNAGSSSLQMVSDLTNKIQMDNACNIQFTSGTTGKPKGVTLSHHNACNIQFTSGTTGK